MHGSAIDLFANYVTWPGSIALVSYEPITFSISYMAARLPDQESNHDVIIAFREKHVPSIKSFLCWRVVSGLCIEGYLNDLRIPDVLGEMHTTLILQKVLQCLVGPRLSKISLVE